MGHLIDLTGGEEAWREATVDERMRLIRAVFDQFPLICTKHCFHYENNSIDFENIWRSTVDGREQMQILCRTKFVNLAYWTYQHRYLEDDKSEALFKWKYHMLASCVRKMGIGAVGTMFSRPSRSAGHARELSFAVLFRSRRFEPVEMVPQL